MLVEEHEVAAENEKAAHESRQKLREVHCKLMAARREAEEYRKQRNKEHREVFYEEVHAWEEERDLAKQEGQWIGWSRPKLGKLETTEQKLGGESMDAGSIDGWWEQGQE
ncbi:hypothetical protein PAXRUDRAFT_17872 [Paxillus rubicundulus Ve08.2h10]|uniref:Uncharacterized protein n=1 Tax=Paxillus rubicundulus Ve08.2h10 TaxID=930991 RepID=A0A0D0CNS2_9AGAM|nr:hypothetical protein PAXRUDRAFT_17872 [Paxillus rubicundulus Ve08.2h10]